jgi:hypothetical protein
MQSAQKLQSLDAKNYTSDEKFHLNYLSTSDHSAQNKRDQKQQ